MRMAGSAAEGMMLLGDAVSNLAYGMQLRQDEAFLTDFEVQTAKGLTQNLSDLSQSKFTDLVGPDGRKIGAERLDGYFQKLRDESDRVAQGNPRLGAAMKERIGRAQIHGTGALQQIESQKFRDYDRSVLQEAITLDSQAYASAQNDGERGIILARGLGRFASRRGTTLTEQEAVDHAQKWATQTHVDYVTERLKTDPMIASGSPEQAAKMVADMTDPLKYPFLGGQAKNHIIQLFLAARKHEASGAVYDGLYKAFNGDFALMGAYLNDPENRKKTGLNMEDVDYLRGFISRADTDKKQLQTKIHDQTATEIFLNMKSMTPGKIDAAVASGKLDYKTATHFKNELKQVGEGRTEPATYDRFLQAIYSGAQGPEEIRAQLYRTSGLSRADKEKLLNKTEANIEKLDAKNLTRAMAYLKETVMPSQTMITAAKPDEALNYLKAAESMEDAVLSARKLGKPLSSKQVIEKAQEISQTFKMSTREQMDAARNRMAEDAKKMKPVVFIPAKQQQVGPKLLKYNPATGELE